MRGRYEEVYERSPHPPDIRLSEAFMDNPEVSYIAIERRLRTRKSLDRYYPILFQIEQNSHETMCKDDRRSLVENTLMRGAANPPLFRPLRQALSPDGRRRAEQGKIKGLSRVARHVIVRTSFFSETGGLGARQTGAAGETAGFQAAELPPLLAAR